MKQDTIYCTISEAAQRSGLSQYMWRQMVREGEVPYLSSGTKYMINYPAAMRALEEKACKDGGTWESS